MLQIPGVDYFAEIYLVSNCFEDLSTAIAQEIGIEYIQYNKQKIAQKQTINNGLLLSYSFTSNFRENNRSNSIHI